MSNQCWFLLQTFKYPLLSAGFYGQETDKSSFIFPVATQMQQCASSFPFRTECSDFWANKVELQSCCSCRAQAQHVERDGKEHWAKKQCPCAAMWVWLCVCVCAQACRHVSLYRLVGWIDFTRSAEGCVCQNKSICMFFFPCAWIG